MNCTNIVTLLLLALCLILHSSQSAPIDGNNPYQAINSPTDISGQPVRQKRSQDYFICYPSSVVYGYHNNPNALEPHRRSDLSDRRVSVFDSYEALTNRADRERAAYKDSFGK
ncbi:uncharacterized protein LOC117784426 [Drosophila innubila]|uniref:uncharacterized protein LOC117784426 n=1 Tax=Drosophila innubila TaxID=198719 RepID=UPI00148BEBA7|nr:uncharacterized protein LOC117784426 [Drosophila innubila]